MFNTVLHLGSEFLVQGIHLFKVSIFYGHIFFLNLCLSAPGAFTRVPNYIKWIENTMKKHGHSLNEGSGIL